MGVTNAFFMLKVYTNTQRVIYQIGNNTSLFNSALFKNLIDILPNPGTVSKQ